MIRFLFLGLGVGAIYALIGQGMVVVYRGSGVLNFAQGAFAAAGAYSYYEFRSHGLPTVISVVLGLAAAAVIGAFVQFVVMRPMRQAPPLTRVIASLGVMVVLQQIGDIIWGAQLRQISSFLPTGSVTPISGATVGEDRFILLGIALVISAGLWALYHFSRFGAITAAVAENERTAQFSGHSPDLIAMVNWALGALLAGAAGILIAPIAGLNVDNMVLLIIPALATGVVANFESFTGAFLASVVIGIAQSEITNYVSLSGWSDAVPFLLVIVVLVLRGKPLPLRSHINERLPVIGSGIPNRGALIGGLVVAAALILGTSATWSDAITISLIGGIVCISLVVVTGYAGQLSLAQFGFAGWGAFVSSRVAATQGLPFLVALVIGVAAAVPLGVLVGLPALRTRGMHLAIATFGMAFALQSILFNSVDYTGGLQGTNLANPTVFGWDVDGINHPKRYAFVCLVALLAAGLAAANVRRGRSGRRLVAVRGNERAAASLGVSVYGAKLYAFALSAAIAGLAGVLVAFSSTHVDFTQFTVFGSISVVIYSVIDGVGFLVGAVFAGTSFQGGLVVQIFHSILHSGRVFQYVTLGLAALLVPTLVRYPNGLAAPLAARRSLPWLRLRRSSAEAVTVPFYGQSETVVEPLHRVAAHRLFVDGVSVRFGGVRALEKVSLEVGPGEVIGLMGPNGAGKTTLIDAVTGFVPLREGAIRLDETRVDGASPQRRARLGISRTFQSLELFDQLTVMDNLRTASDPRDVGAYLTDLVRPRAATLTAGATAAIRMFELEPELERLPSELPYGRRRQVAIARAVAMEPSILLLDEPAAGLNESETQELAVSIRRLVDELGMGVLLVEHDVPLLNRVCDRIVAVDFGGVIAVGTPAEVRVDPKVVASYLGKPVESPETSETSETSHVG